VAAECNQVIRTCLGTLIADDAGLRAGAGLGLQAQNASEAWRRWTPLRRILKGERRLRRVLQRHQQPFQQIDEKQRLDEFDYRLH
jgi:hypothetical protein